MESGESERLKEGNKWSEPDEWTHQLNSRDKSERETLSLTARADWRRENERSTKMDNINVGKIWGNCFVSEIVDDEEEKKSSPDQQKFATNQPMTSIKSTKQYK